MALTPIIHNKVKRCVIIGNGPSRRLTDLYSIPHTTFGCNQIYREFQPNYLLAQDREVLHQMKMDAVLEPVYVPQLSYRQFKDNTHTQIHDMRELRLPNTRMNSWLTGEQAMVMAAQLGFTHIDLLGFDGGTDSLYRDPQANPQPHRERYTRTFKIILEYFPKIKITVDQYFTSRG